MNHQTFKISKRNRLVLSSLTCREQEVLQLISHGFSTKDICAELFLGKSTIETYRYRLLSKFDCKNMAQLVRKGFEVGLLGMS